MRLRLGNYDPRFVTARREVRAWEQAHKRGEQ
jgi:hypothetical protein